MKGDLYYDKNGREILWKKNVTLKEGEKMILQAEEDETIMIGAEVVFKAKSGEEFMYTSEWEKVGSVKQRVEQEIKEIKAKLGL